MRKRICYIVIWNDHHSDIAAYVFFSSIKAIKWTRKQLKKYPDIKEEKLTQGMINDKWIFAAYTQSGEDSLHIVKSIINPT